MDNTNCLCTDSKWNITLLGQLSQTQYLNKTRPVSETWNERMNQLYWRGGNLFFTLVTKSGYRHIETDKEDRDGTAFTSHH